MSAATGSSPSEAKKAKNFIQFSEVQKHNKKDDLWIVINSKVYDVTAFQKEHPGGEDVLNDMAGSDATEAFENIGHSENAHELMKSFFIGYLGDPPKNEKVHHPTITTDQKSSRIGLLHSKTTYTNIMIATAFVVMTIGFIYMERPDLFHGLRRWF